MTAPAILVVEDHPASQEYLTAFLRLRNYRVLSAPNAVEGLAIARAERPDLIITDVLMPDCDGYEFTRRLRADLITANIPIIFWTASYARRGSAILLAENFGVECVLAKPTEPQELLSAVEKALRCPSVARRNIGGELREEHTRLLTNQILHDVEGLEDVARLDHLHQNLTELLVVMRTSIDWSLNHLHEQPRPETELQSRLGLCSVAVDDMTCLVRRLQSNRV